MHITVEEFEDMLSQFFFRKIILCVRDFSFFILFKRNFSLKAWSHERVNRASNLSESIARVITRKKWSHDRATRASF